MVDAMEFRKAIKYMNHGKKVICSNGDILRISPNRNSRPYLLVYDSEVCDWFIVDRINRYEGHTFQVYDRKV